MELDEYEHQTMAKLVSRYPNRLSMGITMPTIDVSTRGSRQYPNTEAERGKVSEEPKWELPLWPWSRGAAASAASSGGDMSERMVCRRMVPIKARPVEY
jgi:hypothetical protein